MRFSDIYNKAISLWPEEISINDGRATGNGGYLFEKLTQCHDKIEENIDPSDDWLTIATWSLFQAFHAYSNELIKDNIYTLNTRKLPKSEVEKRIAFHLSEPEWKNIANNYENDL